jgi:hypothetical protein
MSTTGTLMGAITAVESETTVAVEGAQVAVYIDDTNSITTFSDVDGSYMIMGLDTGSYNM